MGILNVTNPNIATTSQEYQGIGGVYAPLGVWYINGSPLLQVGWITGGLGPCDGLQIDLSRDHTEAAFIVVGMIWQWWTHWAYNFGNC